MNIIISILFLLLLICGGVFASSLKEGMVEYIGGQNSIFISGKADPIISLQSLKDHKGLYAIGPVGNFDGEITIIDSKPYISKVRGSDYIVENRFEEGAIFLVWSEETKWSDVPVPSDVKNYVLVQEFVKEKAKGLGIDVTKPFPFLLTGHMEEIKWHINIDRTEGKAVTKELFEKSKEKMVTQNENVEIVGFYSEGHDGIFISRYSPGIKPESGVKNCIHMHFVSLESKATGHIDDFILGPDMVLRLPAN